MKLNKLLREISCNGFFLKKDVEQHQKITIGQIDYHEKKIKRIIALRDQTKKEPVQIILDRVIARYEKEKHFFERRLAALGEKIVKL